jgi:hypothetical protein
MRLRAEEEEENKLIKKRKLWIELAAQRRENEIK